MKKWTNRTTALLVAAVLLLVSGGVAATRAALNIQSQYFRAHFYLNHLQVHLMEQTEADSDYRDVCDGVNDLDGSAKVTGKLLQNLGYDADDAGNYTQLGTIEPGRKYREKIAAENGQDIDEYIRLTIRRYWVDTATGEKTTLLDPDLIHLTYGDKAYNNGAWILNDQETTAESTTYYYKTTLGAGEISEPVCDTLMIDKKVADKSTLEELEPEVRDDGTKIFRYKYKYDGLAFFIEADVQAIQTHNAADAIHSQWGVYNVTPSGSGLRVTN